MQVIQKQTTMKRIVVFSIATAMAATAATAQMSQRVTVSNPSDFVRNAEPITIMIDETKDIKSAIVTFNGEEIPCQLDDLDQNGKPDQLFFIASLGKRAANTYNIAYSTTAKQRTYEPEVYCEMMLTNKKIKATNKQDLYISSLTVDGKTNPYNMLHHHGPAFENKEVAYRIYFDHRQTIDIYGKYSRALELRDTQFYPDAEQKKQGYGDDVLWVGETLGCGALRGWADGKPQMIADLESRGMTIISRGPLRTIVKVTDKGWNPLYPTPCTDEQRITLNTLYILYASRRDVEVSATLSGLASDIKLCTGLINVKNSVELCDGGLRGCWGTDWPVSEKDSAGHKRETVGLGIYVPKAHLCATVPANKDNYAYVVVPKGNELNYRVTFASDNESFSAFHSPEAWFDHLRQWRRELEAPVKIVVQ